MERIKNLLTLLLTFAIVTSLVCITNITVKAEELEEPQKKEHSIRYEKWINATKKEIWEYSFTTDKQLCFVRVSDTLKETELGTSYHYLLVAAEAGSHYLIEDIEATGTQTIIEEKETKYNDLTELTYLNVGLDLLTEEVPGYTYYDLINLNTSIPIFENNVTAYNYMTTGDDSGQVNKPSIDYNYKHDFSKDGYTGALPVPEVSSANHEGFILANWSEEYYVDIIVESVFNGVAIKNLITDTITGNHYFIEYDDEWIFNTHYYNFTLDDRAISQANININDIFGVDIASELISDFKKWSVKYPQLHDLPSYSFINGSFSLRLDYENHHVFNSSEEQSSITQLEKSGQAATSYYIRYYNSDMEYSKWLKYTVRPSYNSSGSVISGTIKVDSVDVDLDGNVSLKEGVTGSIDSEGKISYQPTYSNSSDMNKIDISSSLTDFWSILKGFYNAMDSFPGIIRDLFGYLPSWVTSFMGISLLLVVFLRLIGR